MDFQPVLYLISSREVGLIQSESSKVHCDINQSRCWYPNTVAESFSCLKKEKKKLFNLFLGCTFPWLLFSEACIFLEPRGQEENIWQSLTVRRVESGRAGPGMSCVTLVQWALIPISITQLH